MQAIIALIISAIPQAIMAIAAKLLTADLLQVILTRIIIQGLHTLAKLSTNTIDDDIVDEIEKRLTGKTPDTHAAR